MLLPVPPKSAMTPRRKQAFYDFAIETLNYGNELFDFKDSNDFLALPLADQELIEEEIKMIEKLNEFQVTQIDSY